MSRFCPKCGKQLPEMGGFCPACGYKLLDREKPVPQQAPQDLPKQKKKPPRFFPALLDLIKHPLRLLPTIIISLIWILISLLSAFLRDVPVFGVLASLTYSNGGMFGGALGAIGGIFGKAVVAVVINTIVLSLFQKKNPFKGLKGGFRSVFGKAGCSGLSAVAPFLIGGGAAILLYLFFNITSNPQNCAVAVIGAVAAIQGAGARNGIFFSLLFGILGKLTRGKMVSQMTVSRALTGVTAGFAVAMPVTFARLPFLLLGLGAGILAIGIVLALIGRSGMKRIAASTAAVLMLCIYIIPFMSFKAGAESTGFSITLNTEEGKNSAGEYFVSMGGIDAPMFYSFKSAGTINVTQENGTLKFTIPAYKGTVHIAAKGGVDAYDVTDLSVGSMTFAAPSFGKMKTVTLTNRKGDTMDYSWYETRFQLVTPFDISYNSTYEGSTVSTHRDFHVTGIKWDWAVVEDEKTGKPYIFTGGQGVTKPGTGYTPFMFCWTGSRREYYREETTPVNVKDEQGPDAFVFDMEGGNFFTGEDDEIPPAAPVIVLVSVLTSMLGGTTAAFLTALGLVLGNLFGPPTPPAPETPPAPPEPTPPPEDLGPYVSRDSDGDLNAKDPVTGENRVYVSNGDGTYTNPLSGATFTESELKDWMEHLAENAGYYQHAQKTAAAATAQQRAANQNLSQAAYEYSAEKREMEKQQAEEDKLFKMWLKYGGERDNKESIKAAMEKQQGKNLEDQEYRKKVADRWDTAVKVAETTQVAADIGVDVLASVTGAQGIKTAYTVGKNFASRLSDAVVNDKDISGAIAMAGFDSLADIGMDKAESAGFHIMGDAAGETFKKTMQNLYEGKDWNDGLGQAATAGAVKGGIAKLGSIMQGSQAANTKAQLDSDLRGIVCAQYRGMSPKGVQALGDARIATYINNRHAEKIVNAATTVVGDLGKNSVDGISEAYSNINDAMKGGKS